MRNRHRGLTLLEVLLVIVIMAVVASVMGTGLVAQDAAGRLRAAVSDWRRIDHGARTTAAIEARRMTLRVLDDSTAVLRDAGATIRRWDWDSSVAVTMASRSGVAISDLWIDARGRSADYMVSVRRGARTKSIVLSGVTGAVIAEDEGVETGGAP
ncbi:MAG: Tfp pilus assembly protein FimT/FimU [Phycisphaerales bacterium]